MYKLDYVLEREDAARRDAARCAAYARPRRNALADRLRRLAEQVVGPYLTDRGRRNFLRRLSGVKLSGAQAQTYWRRVQEHKWYLGERLGRDVGVEVAALDYFENVERPLPPARPRLFDWRGLPPRLPMMMPFDERA